MSRTRLREVFGFGAVGLINSGATYLIYVIAQLFMPYAAAYTLAFTAGIGLSYFLNSSFVFMKRLGLRTAATYALWYVAQYGLGLALLAAFIELAAINKLIAPLIVVVILFPVTFAVTRWILTHEPAIKG